MQVEILQIESDDVVDAIKQEIVKGNINKLVIGASSSGMFSRYPILYAPFILFFLFLLFYLNIDVFLVFQGERFVV